MKLVTPMSSLGVGAQAPPAVEATLASGTAGSQALARAILAAQTAPACTYLLGPPPPSGHLPSSREVKETNLVLRLGAREVIQRFISLLGHGGGHAKTTEQRPPTGHHARPPTRPQQDGWGVPRIQGRGVGSPTESP